jgi:hypothetical protein
MIVNVLVDQLQVERVVLVENSQQAMQALRSSDGRVTKVYDVQGIEYRKKGNQELTDSSALNKRARLGVDLEEEKMYVSTDPLTNKTGPDKGF